MTRIFLFWGITVPCLLASLYVLAEVSDLGWLGVAFGIAALIVMLARALAKQADTGADEASAPEGGRRETSVGGVGR